MAAKQLIFDEAARQAIGVGPAFIIDIPLMILADARAVARGVEPGSEGRAFPPGEDVLDDAHGGSA